MLKRKGKGSEKDLQAKASTIEQQRKEQHQQQMPPKQQQQQRNDYEAIFKAKEQLESELYLVYKDFQASQETWQKNQRIVEHHRKSRS